MAVFFSYGTRLKTLHGLGENIPGSVPKIHFQTRQLRLIRWDAEGARAEGGAAKGAAAEAGVSPGLGRPGAAATTRACTPGPAAPPPGPAIEYKYSL